MEEVEDGEASEINAGGGKDLGGQEQDKSMRGRCVGRRSRKGPGRCPMGPPWTPCRDHQQRTRGEGALGSPPVSGGSAQATWTAALWPPVPLHKDNYLCDIGL